MTARATTLVLALLVLAAPLAEARKQKPKPAIVALVLANVSVVEVDAGGYEPDMTVVIRDGRIAAIAKRALVETGRHVQLVNATGKYLVAGRWNMQAGALEGLTTIDVGQPADLLLLDAYPLRDPRETQRVWAAVVKGKFLDRLVLEKMLADSQGPVQTPKN